MSDALDRVEARLANAYEHLERFDLERLTFNNSRPYSARTDVNPDGVTYDWYVDAVTRQPPLPLSIRAGDVLHNARATLDNLAFELWEAHSSLPDPTVPEFLIFKSQTKYAKVGAKRVVGADPQAQAIIRGLQPYNPTPKAFLEYPTSSITTYSPDRHPLWVLYCLSNPDKHRRPNLTVAKIVGHNLIGTSPHGTFTESPSTGPLEVGTHLGQFVYHAPPGESGVKMQPEWLPNIAFKDPPAAVWPAHYYMLSILDFIKVEVLLPLKSYL